MGTRTFDYASIDREHLGRSVTSRKDRVPFIFLRVEEAREVTAMARRLAALVLLRPALDANYHAVAADTYLWAADAGR